MNKYINSLTLSYFRSLDGDYDLSELKSLLGLQQNQLDKLIMELKKEGYIAYDDFELKITNKGILHLISNNQIDFSVENSEYNYKHINNSELLSLDKPYVPKKFLTKI